MTENNRLRPSDYHGYINHQIYYNVLTILTLHLTQVRSIMQLKRGYLLS